MSLFNQTRLTNAAFKLDVERMRLGWYSDKYFENIEAMLSRLAADHAGYEGKHPSARDIDLAGADIGNMPVEMQ
ncbi:MAG: nicotinate phosphoribosyltransferase, partial [Longimicrobiales bacterium]